MLFGWQRFQFELPDDWAPVALHGTFKEGYARLASPHHVSMQLRWKSASSVGDLGERLGVYLSRLRNDAKRRRTEFTFSSKEEERGLGYRWSGDGAGAGLLFFSPPCSRIFFVEATSSKGSVPIKALNTVLDSFQSGESTWSVLGLVLNLEAQLEKHRFVSGKTELHFRMKGVSIHAVRWGFAEQLLRKHELAEWAKAGLAMPKANVASEEKGLRLTQNSLLHKQEALVHVSKENNQIVTLKTLFRGTHGSPQWAWLP